jgi:hypothetical protein
MEKPEIYIGSSYDSWFIQVKGGGQCKGFYWNHNDSHLGVGGEKMFAEVLKQLGYKTTVEDCY